MSTVITIEIMKILLVYIFLIICIVLIKELYKFKKIEAFVMGIIIFFSPILVHLYFLNDEEDFFIPKEQLFAGSIICVVFLILVSISIKKIVKKISLMDKVHNFIGYTLMKKVSQKEKDEIEKLKEISVISDMPMSTIREFISEKNKDSYGGLIIFILKSLGENKLKKLKKEYEEKKIKDLK